MPKFSESSLRRLRECDQRLQDVCFEAIKTLDFTVLCGYRGREEQEKAFAEGKSKARFGQSPHNRSPSMAVDLAPWPIDWDNIDRFRELNEVIQEAAKVRGVQVEWGGNWKSFKDYPHWEIKGWNK